MKGLKDGDVVLVRTRVQDHWPNDSDWVAVQGIRGEVVRVARESIVKVEPKPIAVGDRVSGWPEGEVVAISGDFAWVKTALNHGGYITKRVADLRRVS